MSNIELLGTMLYSALIVILSVKRLSMDFARIVPYLRAKIKPNARENLHKKQEAVVGSS